MPTRSQVDSSINELIIPQGGSDKITSAEHRQANKEILNYVDQQDAAISAAITAATTGLASQSYVNEQISAAISAAIAAFGIPPGGTTGQALVKASDTNYDTEWASVGAVDPDPMVEYTSVASDPYAALQSGDAFDYDKSVPYNAASVVLDLHDHPEEWYTIIRRPEGLAGWAYWDESGTLNQNIAIPGAQFPGGRIFTANGHEYLVTGAVNWFTNPSARVTLHN